MPSASLPIKYDTPVHRQVLEALKSRVTLSEEYMSDKHDDWRRAEESFLAYLPETEANRVRRTKREDGKPQYTDLVVPYSYATLMTAHTYYTSVFLARNPIFQHIGRHGEADKQVQSIDALMDYQVNVGSMLPVFYTWLLDPGKYGFGVVWNYWTEETSHVSYIRDEAEVVNGFSSGNSRKVRVVQEVQGYKGNKLFNVSPWDFLPDPRVSLMDVQRGEFVGRKFKVSWNEILKGEAQGRYFNVEKLREVMKHRRTHGFDKSDGSEQITKVSDRDPGTVSGIDEIGFVDLIELVVEFVPAVWGIGDSQFPEKWVFTMADKEIIIGMAPLGSIHSKFPVGVLVQEPESYGLLPPGMIERTKPVNDVIDWLVNTHFHNTRAAVNNQFIYDPSRLVETDMFSETPGKRIRMRPEAYGQDVRTMFYQIPINDVTRGHMADLNIVYELASRITGVTDNIMGMLSPRGRKTATEVRTSSSFGVNRLKTTTEFYSALGWMPLDQMMLQNTQQYYDSQQKFRIAGDLMGVEEPFLSIKPEDIQGFYDFIPVDGTLPVDRFAMSALWNQMFQQMRNYPQLMVGYDIPGMFEMVAQMAGMKSIKQFRVQVQPDEQVAAQAAAGNLVPLPGTGGRGGGTSGGEISGGSAGGVSGVEGPDQIPGMGQLG